MLLFLALMAQIVVSIGCAALLVLGVLPFGGRIVSSAVQIVAWVAVLAACSFCSIVVLVPVCIVIVVVLICTLCYHKNSSEASCLPPK